MTNIYLDITPLDRAVARLSEGLQRHYLNIDDDLLRDGLLLRFKLAYDVSHKILKRYLERSSGYTEDFNRMSFQRLIQTGKQRGLLKGNWTNWEHYREMRGNVTLSNIDEDVVNVVKDIPAFLDEAGYLALQLRKQLS